MKTRLLILALVLALLLGVVGVALAQGGGVERPRWVLGGGASDSAAEDVTLRATLGQPVVGVVSGGNVILGQGYWTSVGPAAYPPPADQFIFLPVVLRN